MSYTGFLAELLMAECEDRDRRRAEHRIRAAHFPREKSLREFDYSALRCPKGLVFRQAAKPNPQE